MSKLVQMNQDTWVNPDHVLFVTSMGDMTIVQLINGQSQTLDQPIGTVLEKLGYVT